jgi:hypothetical protein
MDSKNIPVFAFAPVPFSPEISFLTFPLKLNEHYWQFFDESPFCARKRFDSYSAHAFYYGILTMMLDCLMHYPSTHFLTIHFLFPLMKGIQRIIRDQFPETCVYV